LVSKLGIVASAEVIVEYLVVVVGVMTVSSVIVIGAEASIGVNRQKSCEDEKASIDAPA
jgi:hypothetical protein